MSTQSGQLVKLKIEAYKTIEFNDGDKIGEFDVLYNPTTYTEKFEIEYDDKQAQGTSSNEYKFSKTKPQDYSFEFLFDGTGVSKTEAKPDVDVSQMVGQFLDLTYNFEGGYTSTSFCKIIWGHLIVRCVLKSATVNYTLLNRMVFLYEAKVQASFGAIEHERLRTAREAKNSPDLTHYRVAKGDNLPIMTYRIYKEMSWYPEVAQYNGLENFREIKKEHEYLSHL